MDRLLEQVLASNNGTTPQTIEYLQDRLDSLQTQILEICEATVNCLIYALELHDGESRAHANRVSKLALELAKELNIPESNLIYIRYGALLHDIGKIGVPGQILQKKETLDQGEWDTIRKHPIHSHNLLSLLEFLEPALDIPYYHHEWWDGTGYPCGLKGEQIPLTARIFAVVDVWDALRSNRPYRTKKWTDMQILAYIKRNAGRQFDPAIVKAFTCLIQKTLIAG